MNEYSEEVATISSSSVQHGIPPEHLAALNNIGAIRNVIAAMGGAGNKAGEKL